jgi:3-hydroxyacyl-CoA dehydrogenase
MNTRIEKVAVLGSGVMGSGIAAHLANAGIDTYLFDIAPKDGGDSPAARTAIATAGLMAAVKSRPPALYDPEFAKRITPCNYDDHGDILGGVDWIVEVVVERLDIKQKVFSWVADHRKPGTILSSNTSGIKIEDMTAQMPEEMKGHFLVTHFFNPVRYMKLLELVPGPDTRPDVMQRLTDFGANTLGKGLVTGNDTPNFIANRIGTFGIASAFHHMERLDLTVEEVDAVLGAPLARPKSACFRTADLVGLDTMKHVLSNVYDNAPDDERREWFVSPNYLDQLIESGRTGDKAGSGFYKKTKIDGKRAILALDTKTMEYRPKQKVRLDCIGAARKADKLSDKVRAMVYGNEDDKGAQFAWAVTADTLIYAANRIPEITDDIVSVDNAMKWGFGWDLGPFETWDAMGVAESVAKMEAEGRTVPAWVHNMLSSGRTSFYDLDGGQPTFATINGTVSPVPANPRHLVLSNLSASGKRIERNVSASLYDLGDGILNLEFHSKMNSLDEMIFAQMDKAFELLDNDQFRGLVIGNQAAKAFSAGANLLMILMNAMQEKWSTIETDIHNLQQAMMRAKYSDKPIVTAPHGLTLAGGAEVAMHSSATVAAGELYMGLVEVGVGVIPAAGGCKELLMRYSGDIPQDIDYDPTPFAAKAFERIAMAKVSSSAEEARNWGYLRPTDKIVLDSDAVLAEAKNLALGLSIGGYEPPQQRTVKVAGTTGRAALELFLYGMREGGFATPHDICVGNRLANVLAGGDVPAGTVRTEQDLLDLEREAFLSLCGEPNTIARIQHMLQTGKPLRN